jgi:hypothetical protein
MADAYHKGISLVTLSKPWGGCGITIGWQEIFPLLYHHALLAHSSIDDLIIASSGGWHSDITHITTEMI